MFRTFRKRSFYFSQVKSTFFVTCTITFVAFFASSLGKPTVPYLLETFLTQEAAVVAMIGNLNSLFNLAKLVTNIPSAVLSDVFERRKIIFVSFVFLPFSFLLLWFATSSWWVLAAYVLLGVFTGLSMPSFNAMVADLTPYNTRAMAFAVFNLSWIASQAAALSIGGFLSDEICLRFPFILAFMISTTASLFYVTLLKKWRNPLALPKVQDEVCERRDSVNYVKSFKKILALLCSMQFFSGFANGSLTLVTTVFLLYVLKISPLEMGLVLSLGWGVTAALAQIPGGKMGGRFGAKLLVVISTLIATPLLLLQPFSKNIFQFALLLGLTYFIVKLPSPSFSAWIGELIATEKRGKGYGFTSASWGAGAVVGPIVASYLWAILEPNYFLPFIAVALLFLLQVPFLVLIKEKSEMLR